MGVIKFDIRFANGHRESAEIEGERALIGSASYCDVRLPMDQAAYEHVLVEVRGDTLRAEAKADDPSPTINGMPLTAGTLSPDAVLGVGNVKMFVTYVSEMADGAKVATKDKNQSSPTIRIAALLGAAAAAYLLLLEEPSGIAAAPTKPPDLFAALPSATCPQAEPEQALAMAKEQVDIAEGKRERMPFAAKEGISAVGLYQTAAACFGAGHDDKHAKEAAETATALKRILTDDFRARQLRLEHMLAVEDYELVKTDVSVLEAMTDGQTGEYVEWLKMVRKQVEGLPAEE